MKSKSKTLVRMDELILKFIRNCKVSRIALTILRWIKWMNYITRYQDLLRVHSKTVWHTGVNKQINKIE